MLPYRAGSERTGNSLLTAGTLDVLDEIMLSVDTAERMCAAFVATAQPYWQPWRAARGGSG